MERRILGPEDRDKIRFDHEKEVADFLIDTFPHAFLYYERRHYEIRAFQEETNQESVSSTLPDFELEDPSTDSLLAIVEVTRSNRMDAKQKQQTVMRKALPDVPYIILRGSDIDVIRKRHEIRGGEIFDRSKNLQRLGRLLQPLYLAAD